MPQSRSDRGAFGRPAADPVFRHEPDWLLACPEKGFFVPVAFDVEFLAADILIALCLGAQFVFFGRPTLYGAIVSGVPGVNKVVDIFRKEIDLVMGQIGCPSLDQLGPDFLWREDWTQNR